MPPSEPDGAKIRRAGSPQRIAFVILVPLLACLFSAAPSVLGAYELRILSTVFMFATLAQAFNLIAGFAGYPAFGNVVFFGLGAYCTAIVVTKGGGSVATGLVLATVLPFCAALILGPALFRLRGPYFAVATIGLNELVKALVNNLTPLTGGGMGISLPLPRWTPFESALIFYYVLFITMIISIVVAALFKHSRLGLVALAVREDELRAQAMGLPTTIVKTIAWALSAGLTGAVGGIYAYWLGYVEPPAVFDLLISIKAFVILLLGGAGTVVGPIVAAFVVEFLSTVLWSVLLEYHLGALGLGIILIVLHAPNGFGQLLRDRVRSMRRSRCTKKEAA